MSLRGIRSRDVRLIVYPFTSAKPFYNSDGKSGQNYVNTATFQTNETLSMHGQSVILIPIRDFAK